MQFDLPAPKPKPTPKPKTRHHEFVRQHYDRCLAEGFTPYHAAAAALVELLIATQHASEPNDPCYECGELTDDIRELGVGDTITRLHLACYRAYWAKRESWAASVLDEAMPPADRQPQKKEFDNG